MEQYTVLYTLLTLPHSSSSSCNWKHVSMGSLADVQHTYVGSLMARYAFNRSHPSATTSDVRLATAFAEHHSSQAHRGGCGFFTA